MEEMMAIDDKEYDRLNQLFQKKNLNQMSGVEFLNILEEIKCSEITIDYECYQRDGWLKKEELAAIFARTQSKEPCIKVNTLADELKGKMIDHDSLFIPKSTVGIEALRLINSYYIGVYPCKIKYNRNQVDSMLRK